MYFPCVTHPVTVPTLRDGREPRHHPVLVAGGGPTGLVPYVKRLSPTWSRAAAAWSRVAAQLASSLRFSSDGVPGSAV